MSMETWMRRFGVAAAMLSVLATGLVGAPTTAATTGFLQVTSSPSLATQISVDGQIANSRSVNGLELAAGVHTMSFSHVPGYTEPASQNVTITAGNTTTLTGTFTQRGPLQVVTVPPLVVATQVSIDNHPADNYGLATDVPAGVHQVCFGAVAGYAVPPCQSATVTAGTVPTVVSGAFIACLTCVGMPGVGYLRVQTTGGPVGPTGDPGLPTQILVDGFIADSWGLNWLQIPPGAHTVCFTHVDGYTEPPCQNVSVVAGTTTSVTGNFPQRGQLRVITSPAAPGTILVDGVARDSWGIWTDFPAGSHTVCFGSVPGFVNTPACQTVTVTAGAETDVTGVYS